jgi:hypothetical protein
VCSFDGPNRHISVKCFEPISTPLSDSATRKQSPGKQLSTDQQQYKLAFETSFSHVEVEGKAYIPVVMLWCGGESVKLLSDLEFSH